MIKYKHEQLQLKFEFGLPISFSLTIAATPSLFFFIFFLTFISFDNIEFRSKNSMHNWQKIALQDHSVRNQANNFWVGVKIRALYASIIFAESNKFASVRKAFISNLTHFSQAETILALSNGPCFYV